jgi:hypothetical protein
VNDDKNVKPLNGIKELKKMDLKKVSTVTHIALKTLNNMIDSKFDSLSPAKTVGFLRILENEYGLNFDEWHSSYIKYLEVARDEEIKKELLSDFEQTSKVPYFLAAIIACIVLVYFIYPQIQLNSENDLLDKKNLEKINKNLEKNVKIKIDKPIDINTSDDLKEPIQNNLIQEEKSEEKLLEEESKEIEPIQIVEKTIIEEPIIKKTIIKEIKKEFIKNDDKNITKSKIDFKYLKEIALEENSSIKITTGNKLWIGLSRNGIKSDFTLTKVKRLYLKENTIFFTGHGFFTLHYLDQQQLYRGRNKKYFYVTNNILYEIDRATFKELDKEKIW